jgi:hypothetical protein
VYAQKFFQSLTRKGRKSHRAKVERPALLKQSESELLRLIRKQSSWQKITRGSITKKYLNLSVILSIVNQILTQSIS